MIKRCFSKAESHREHEAWVDPGRGDLLLLTDVKEDPVLDSTRNQTRKKRTKNKNSKLFSMLRCFVTHTEPKAQCLFVKYTTAKILSTVV